MSTNISSMRRNGPRLPDTVSTNNLGLTIVHPPNEENHIVAENDSEKNHLVVTDKNGDQVDKYTNLSQVELSDELERILGSRYLDSLDELDKTFYVPYLYKKKVKIIIKRSE